MSLSSSAVRMMLRPMRPKPLMPTLMGITSSDGMSKIAAAQERTTAAGEQEMLWAAWGKVNARTIGVAREFPVCAIVRHVDYFRLHRDAGAIPGGSKVFRWDCQFCQFWVRCGGNRVWPSARTRQETIRSLVDAERIVHPHLSRDVSARDF